MDILHESRGESRAKQDGLHREMLTASAIDGTVALEPSDFSPISGRFRNQSKKGE
jgi:hypothetical protein